MDGIRMYNIKRGHTSQKEKNRMFFHAEFSYYIYCIYIYIYVNIYIYNIYTHMCIYTCVYRENIKDAKYHTVDRAVAN